SRPKIGRTCRNAKSPPLPCAARARATSAERRRREAGGDDPQAQVGWLSPLFAQSQPEDGPSPQSPHVQDARGGREAPARRAVLQASLRLRRRIHLSHADPRATREGNSSLRRTLKPKFSRKSGGHAWSRNDLCHCCSARRVRCCPGSKQRRSTIGFRRANHG